MDVYANVKNYALRYSDCDFKDEIKLSALLSLTQESACASADELGFGYDDLRPLGFGFIVVHTYCAFRRPIVLGDALTVETWPLPPRHVFFERDYCVRDAKGEEVAALASRWCLVDLKSFSLLTPEKLGAAHTNCPYRDEKAVEPPAWKIAKTEGAEVRRFRAYSSDCDHYLHVNNARYADLFLDCFSMDELAGRKITAFQISYLKQVKEGDELLFTRKDEDSTSTIEAFADGERCSQFKIYFEEKR